MPFSSVLGASSVIKPGVVTSSTRPSAPYVGQLIFETDTNRLAIWNGSSWIMLADADTPPGLELVKTQTIGSAVSSVTVSDVFSATYDAYEVIVSGGTGSTNLELNLTFGSTTSNYRWSSTGTSYSTTFIGAGSFSASNIRLVGTADATSISASMRIINPFLTEITMVSSNLWYDASNIGSVRGYLNDTTSYTSFTLTTNTGTLTGGTIRVYGYRNS